MMWPGPVLGLVYSELRSATSESTRWRPGQGYHETNFTGSELTSRRPLCAPESALQSPARVQPRPQAGPLRVDQLLGLPLRSDFSAA